MVLDFTQCRDWTPWREALRIPNQGGGYVVEYIFYIIYSVWHPPSLKPSY